MIVIGDKMVIFINIGRVILQKLKLCVLQVRVDVFKVGWRIKIVVLLFDMSVFFSDGN